MLRIGIGHDTHRFEPANHEEKQERLIRLGGVSIPYHRALLGHSDADVLLHAITDSLLGAAALGDIGEYFPDTDDRFRGIDSAFILTQAAEEIRSLGWRIVNIDTILFAEKPKLSPYKKQIAQRIAEILHLQPDQVGVKAKTGERIGIVGREEAICAEVVVLLEK